MTLEEALAKIKAQDESIAALTAKNAELIGEKRKVAGDLGDLAERLAKIEADRAAKAAETAGEYEKAKELMTKAHQADLAKIAAERDQFKAAAQKLAVTDTLKAELVKAGVQPHFIPAVEAMMGMQKTEVEVRDGLFAATIAGKPVAEHVAEWAKSEAAKHFIGSGNSGGGAGGSGAPAAASGLKGNPYAKETLNLTEQGKLEKSNPALAKQLKAAAAAA